MPKSSKKFWMWTIGTISTLAVAAIIGWFLIKKDLSKPDSAVEKKMGQLFTDMIVEASDSLYKVSFTKFDLDPKSGKGLISDLKLIPDSAVLARLKKVNRAPNNVMDVFIKSILINNLRFIKTDQGRKLAIQNIIVQTPSIRMTNKLQADRIEANKDKLSKLLSLLQTALKLSEIENFSFRNMNFVYANNNGPSLKKTALKGINMDMSGITSIESDQNGTKSTAIRVFKSRMATPDSLYYLIAQDINLMPQKGQATIKLAELRPRLTKEAYFKKVKWAKDRIVLVYRDLSMKHIDLQQLLKKQQLHVGLMESSAAFTEIYTNYNWPRRVPPIRRHPFPHQQFKDLAFDITIDTMKLNKSDAHWRVLAAHSDQVSSLDFLKGKGTILNITNNQAQIASKPYTSVTMNGLLNNAATMNLKMRLDLKDQKGKFTVSSTTGKMDATFLNRFSEPFAMVRVKEGTIDKMDLQLNVNDAGGIGNVDLYYTGMKVALLKEDKQTKELKQRSLISALSNAMLPNDNPAKNGKFKKGPINAKREPQQSFFGFLSKCMLDGMTSAMTGLEQDKKEKDGNIITKVGRAIIGNPMKKKNN
jgi:hypothetical protein